MISLWLPSVFEFSMGAACFVIVLAFDLRIRGWARRIALLVLE